MSSAKTLTGDPRYLEFVRRYAHDCLRFACEVVGLEPTHQQVELFNSVSPPGSRTSVSSGHGTGKTNAIGIIGLWHFLVYVRSNTIITGPRIDTVRGGAWKEFAGHHAAMLAGPHAWICDYFTIETEKVYVKGHKLDWWIVGKTAPVGRPENIAGAHNAWLMWLCDEASGIPDANFGVIGGSLTDARNRMLMTSQPTRPSGYFYESHNARKKEAGGVWNALTFNSEDSPLVSDGFIKEKLQEYGGEDDPEYQIKVQGRFPENGEGFLLGRKSIERLIESAPAITPDEAYGHMVVIDVGAGVYRDRTVATHVKVIGDGDRLDHDPRRIDVIDIPIFSNSMDWTNVCGEVIEYSRQLSNVTFVVDVGGQGEQFARLMERLGMTNIIRVNWGKESFRLKNKERFFNQRAQCSVHAKEAVIDGRITFIKKHEKYLLDQGSRIPYFFDEKVRYHIQPKEKMAEKGIPSPDLWDTICMAFLDVAHFIPADDHAIQHTDESEQIAESLSDSISEALGLG